MEFLFAVGVIIFLIYNLLKELWWIALIVLAAYLIIKAFMYTTDFISNKKAKKARNTATSSAALAKSTQSESGTNNRHKSEATTRKTSITQFAGEMAVAGMLVNAMKDKSDKRHHSTNNELDSLGDELGDLDLRLRTADYDEIEDFQDEIDDLESRLEYCDIFSDKYTKLKDRIDVLQEKIDFLEESSEKYNLFDEDFSSPGFNPDYHPDRDSFHDGDDW